MDLSVRRTENISFLLGEIVTKLQLVNKAVIQPEDFSIDQYDELYDLYKLVSKKEQLTVSEIEAIMDELRSIRSK